MARSLASTQGQQRSDVVYDREGDRGPEHRVDPRLPSSGMRKLHHDSNPHDLAALRDGALNLPIADYPPGGDRNSQLVGLSIDVPLFSKMAWTLSSSFR
jgi:hypothetical protein